MTLELVEVCPENVEPYGLCFYKDPGNEKYQKKLEWFKNSYEEGLKYKVLFCPEKESMAGFIEYIPGEYAWRGIEAENYLIIHCLVIKKEYAGRGWGSFLLDHCINEAREQEKIGVAAIASKKTWCCDQRIYLKNDFFVVEQTPPGLQLVARKIREGPDPTFGNLEEKMKPYQSGVYMFNSGQCPFMCRGEKFYRRKEELEENFGIQAEVIELKSAEEARTNPCVWGTYGVIAGGRVINHVPGGHKGFFDKLYKLKIIE